MSTITTYAYGLIDGLMVKENVEIFNIASQQISYQYDIIYTYDYDGTLIGFTFKDDSTLQDYIYTKNLQGDITAISTIAGGVVVYYQYDAFGNIRDFTGSQANTIGIFNSYKFKDYKYDSEIKMYYLNSRYYDPKLSRFINSDGIIGDVGNLQSHNMYAYCVNNPIMYIDKDGYFWDTVLDIGFIGWDIYDIIFDDGYKDWKNWLALGVDLFFAAIPFITGGGSKVIKLANIGDDLTDFSKVTVIGETMVRVQTVSQFVNAADNLYDGFKAYNTIKDVGKGGKLCAEVLGKGSNILWLYNKLRNGYKVVDIGYDSMRLIRSSSYIVEKVALKVWQTRNIWKWIYHLDS